MSSKALTLAEALAVDVVRTEALGRATVLHLRLDDAPISIAIEPPIAPSPFGGATVVVSDTKTGSTFLAAIARWLDVRLPPAPRDLPAKPPPAHIGAIALQVWVDDEGATWHRTKLCAGAAELYLIWPESGTRAFFSEKDAESRDSLVEELGVVLRGDAPVAASDADEAEDPDPLRLDRAPLVTSLVRTHRRPVSVVGFFWRGERVVFAEYDGTRTAIVALGLDDAGEQLATIDAPVRYLHEAGPHVVATAEYPRDAEGNDKRELWIVRAGEKIGRKLLAHDPAFDPGQMARPLASTGGELLAIDGRGHREGEGYVDSVRIVDPNGWLVAEIAEPETNLRAEAWLPEGLVLAADRYGDPVGRRRWDPRNRVILPLVGNLPKGHAQRLTVGLAGTDGLEVRDSASGATRALGRLRRVERERLEKYGERALRLRYVGEHHAVIEMDDHILLDCETLRSWVIVPALPAAVELSPSLGVVAIFSYGGGLLLGRVSDRWRTKASPPDEDPAAILERLCAAVKGERFEFDGVPSRVVCADWAEKLSMPEHEVVARLQAAGRASVAASLREIDSAIRSWRAALRIEDAARVAATNAASVDVPGAPGVVWAAIANRGAAAIDEEELTKIDADLKRLAAARFVRTLQHDRAVREVLALSPVHE